MNYTNSPLELSLPRVPQVSDVGAYKELLYLYNALQAFHGQLSGILGIAGLSSDKLSQLGIPYNLRLGLMNVVAVKVESTVAVGELVNLYEYPGEVRGRLASNAAATRQPAHAVALDSGAAADYIRVGLGGNLLIGAYTPGQYFYLGPSGDFVTSSTLVVGEVSQLVGFAVDSEHLVFSPGQPFRVYAHNPQVTMTGSLLQDESGAVLYASGPISGVTKYYEPVLVPM